MNEITAFHLTIKDNVEIDFFNSLRSCYMSRLSKILSHYLDSQTFFHVRKSEDDLKGQYWNKKKKKKWITKHSNRK